LRVRGLKPYKTYKPYKLIIKAGFLNGSGMTENRNKRARE
jgi:hypothetical protein